MKLLCPECGADLDVLATMREQVTEIEALAKAAAWAEKALADLYDDQPEPGPNPPPKIEGAIPMAPGPTAPSLHDKPATRLTMSEMLKHIR